MDLSKATHEQISNYKQEWIPNGFVVRVESDLDVKGKDWCRHNLERWMWSMEAFVDNNHHKFIFEHEEDATDFSSDLSLK